MMEFDVRHIPLGHQGVKSLSGEAQGCHERIAPAYRQLQGTTAGYNVISRLKQYAKDFLVNVCVHMYVCGCVY